MADITASSSGSSDDDVATGHRRRRVNFSFGVNGVRFAAAAACWNTDDFERGRVDDAIRASGAVRHPHPVQIGVAGFIGDCTQGRLARPAIGYGQRIISSALSDVCRSTGVIYRAPSMGGNQSGVKCRTTPKPRYPLQPLSREARESWTASTVSDTHPSSTNKHHQPTSQKRKHSRNTGKPTMNSADPGSRTKRRAWKAGDWKLEEVDPTGGQTRSQNPGAAAKEKRPP
ncbi:hypothetical protein HPB47_005839 [Ixodes persulcatus]|uniref:Uncharacterized protein n=1 Tax=Ixodes persulcatus TaxID=34615 RepID=A0AC60PBV9_IXOPE|nr:hypothetical protein HPB47_005839 [Ixodes persulcatus]